MKVRKLLSLIINIIAVIAATNGIVIIKGLQPVTFIKYFTLITNLLIIVMGTVSIGYAVDGLIKKDKDLVLPDFVFASKLIVGVNSIVTFLTVVTYLQYSVYSTIGPDNWMFWNNITLHYLAPLSFA